MSRTCGQLPVEERKARLAELCGKRKTSGVRLSEHLEGDGPTIFEHVCRMGLEGIVSKRIGSRYNQDAALPGSKQRTRNRLRY